MRCCTVMSGRKADGGEGRLFQIGDMARLFHLSVSSIRHYEASAC